MLNLIQTKSLKTGSRIYIDQTSGLIYPSVSVISKFFFSTYGLYLWRQRVGKEEAQRISIASAKRGTEIHYCIENELTTTPTPEYQLWLDSYLATKPTRASTFFNIGRELKVNYLDKDNPRVRWAGTLDWLVYDSLTCNYLITDFKCSDNAKDAKYFSSYALQLAAYALCFDYEINDGLIINITPNETYYWKTNLDLAKDFIKFIALNYWLFYEQDLIKYPSDFIKKEIRNFEKQQQQLWSLTSNAN